MSEKAYPSPASQVGGLTVLDHFAVEAMKSLIVMRKHSGDNPPWHLMADVDRDNIAEESYLMAKVMMKERERHV